MDEINKHFVMGNKPDTECQSLQCALYMRNVTGHNYRRERIGGLQDRQGRQNVEVYI